MSADRCRSRQRCLPIAADRDSDVCRSLQIAADRCRSLQIAEAMSFDRCRCLPDVFRSLSMSTECLSIAAAMSFDRFRSLQRCLSIAFDRFRSLQRCLSMPFDRFRSLFDAFRCLSMPFDAFRCLSIPAAIGPRCLSIALDVFSIAFRWSNARAFITCRRSSDLLSEQDTTGCSRVTGFTELLRSKFARVRASA